MTRQSEDTLLLRFRVANHRSLRDLVELSLASPELHGNVPPDGNWIDATTRVAGIYGANASGKSTVLHALDFMVSAIANSATSWADRDWFPFQPFALDEQHRELPSLYEIDIVVDEIRYTYGFESNSSGIRSEWLYSYHSPWKRTLFERTGLEMRFGRALRGENQTISKLLGPTNLFLSVAANSHHPVLRRIHHRITRHIRYARHAENDRHNRIRWIRQLLADRTIRRQAEAMISLADLGISSLTIKRRRLDDESLTMARRLYKALLEEPDSGTETQPSFEEFVEEVSRQIHFDHYTSESDRSVAFGIERESSGTVAWLSLGVPALNALKYGETYLIDELDSSLHPRLSAALIQMFKDPELNPEGAQLVFTSHDVSLMGKLLGDVLSVEEVWFIEKSEGASDLYSLEEFSVRKGDNFEKRYLEGRYGAIPIIQFAEIRQALLESADR